MRKLIGVVILLLSTQNLFSYDPNYYSVNNEFSFQQEVSGNITDENGMPLPGVTVAEKGTSNGVVTDFDGHYSLTVSGETTLTISYLGYLTQELSVQGRAVLNIKMEPDAAQLSEVVVLGYGKQKKVNLTGSVSTLDMDEVSDIPAPNTASLLQGRIPGLTVTSGGGQPGKDNPGINIRGIGTLGNTNPMIVIDGVEANSFNQVAPSDIESISVLKDAASAAIYGVRAANGVILITTKQGTKGKPVVNFNSTVSLSNPTVVPDYVDSWDYAILTNEIRGQEIYTPEMIETLRDGTDLDNFANTDWVEAVFRTGVIYKENLSVSGGGENTNYRVSLENLNQEGMMKGTSNNRVNLRSNLDIDLNDNIKLGLNISGSKQHIEEPTNGASEIMRRIDHFARPTVPVRYSNGYFGKWDGAPLQSVNILNPLQEIEEQPRQEDLYRVNAQVNASIDFLKHFNFKSKASIRFNNFLTSRYTPKRKDYDADGVLRFTEPFNSLTDASQTGNTYQFDNYITYDNIFGEKHQFTAMLGSSLQSTRVDNMSGYIEEFPNDLLYELDAGALNPRVGGYAGEHAINSVFGRLNYAFQDKYLLEFNIRRDGSSRIPSENRYGVFPSFSAGWRLSEEAFLKDNNYISQLKLRGSWGKLGNQEIGLYPYSQSLSLNQNYVFGGSLAAGVALTGLANSDISWETTTITNFGADISFFNNKLSIVADYFIKNTSDILLRLPINLSLGNLGAPYQNAGEVENKGFELDLQYRNNLGDINYSFGANLSKVKNKVIDLKELEIISGNSILREGEAINSYYGYIADGIYQSQQEIDEGPVRFNGVVEPGDLRYKDISGPEGVPDGKVNDMDRTIIGNSFPDLTYSFSGSFSYKNLSLSIFLQGVSGANRFSFQSTNGNITERYLDRWTVENPSTKFPRLNGISNTIGSTFWLEDASYLRLKNLELGYDIHSKIFNDKIKSLRIYLLGTNLLTFTNLDNWDPEGGILTYPLEKSYSLGINVKF